MLIPSFITYLMYCCGFFFLQQFIYFLKKFVDPGIFFPGTDQTFQNNPDPPPDLNISLGLV